MAGRPIKDALVRRRECLGLCPKTKSPRVAGGFIGAVSRFGDFAEMHFGAHVRVCSLNFKQDQRDGLKTVINEKELRWREVERVRPPRGTGCKNQKPQSKPPRLSLFGAGGGGRTRTVSLPTDFESASSANSNTPAKRMQNNLPNKYTTPFSKNQLLFSRCAREFDGAVGL